MRRVNIFESLANQLANKILGFGVRPGLRADLVGKVLPLVAHRGVHQDALARENTLEAFVLAMKSGIWGIEFDVHWTKDFIPVVHHDEHLGRFTGRKDLRIRKMTWVDLKKIDPKIPRLIDVVHLLGRRVHFMIELKAKARTEQHKTSLQFALQNLSPQKDYHFMSLRREILDSLDWMDPRALVDIAWFNTEDCLANAVAKNHGGVAGHFVLINQKQIHRARASGINVGTGFIENQGTMSRELNRGISWIFTDRPLDLLPKRKRP